MLKGVEFVELVEYINMQSEFRSRIAILEISGMPIDEPLIEYVLNDWTFTATFRLQNMERGFPDLPEI